MCCRAAAPSVSSGTKHSSASRQVLECLGQETLLADCGASTQASLAAESCVAASLPRRMSCPPPSIAPPGTHSNLSRHPWSKRAMSPLDKSSPSTRGALLWTLTWKPTALYVGCWLSSGAGGGLPDRGSAGGDSDRAGVVAGIIAPCPSLMLVL